MAIQRSDTLSETGSPSGVTVEMTQASEGPTPAASRWRFSTHDRRSGQAHSEYLLTSGETSTGSMARSRIEEERRAAKVRRQKASVLRIRYALRDCIVAVDRAIDSKGDLFERANALAEICEGLDEAWEYRDTREDQFGDLVNHLTLQLRCLEATDVTDGQLAAFGEVLGGLCASSRLTDSDFRRLWSHLGEAGFNPLRGLE